MTTRPAPIPAAPPRTMRVTPEPDLPAALDAAVDRWLEASPPALSGVRIAAASALRRIGLPHSRSEDYSFIRAGELRPYLERPPALDAGANPAEADGNSGAPDPGATDAGPGPAPAVGPAPEPVPEDIARFVIPAARENYVVLVDGVYRPELSLPGEGISVVPLADSTPPDSPLPGMHLRFQGLHAAFLNRIEAALEEEEDAPAALAALFAPHPLLVRIPAKQVSGSPLQILHVSAGAGRRDAFVLVHAGAQSESRVFVRHIALDGGAPTAARPASSAPVAPTAPESRGKDAAAGMENILTLAWIEDGASLKWTELGLEAGGGAADRRLHLRKLSARLDRNARLTAVSAHTGSRLTRSAFGIDLAGEGAEAGIYGAAVLSGSRQGHHHVRLRHLLPHGTSRQMFKTVAADKARGSVDGTIVVALDAQQTNAAQLINNLMLSDEARVDSKPRLMIHADDVKCSHGATVGKLDPAQLFYLISRGLPPEQARALLTVAFIAEALEKAGDAGEPIRDALDHALLDALRARMPGAGSEIPPSGPTEGQAGPGGNHG